MKHFLLLIGALLAITMLAAPAFAGKGTHAAPAGTKYHGKVQSINVTAGQITIANKKDGVHTFTITAATKVKIDGAKAEPSAIQTGARARIWSTDGATATVIKIGKDKNKDNAAINPQV